MFIRMLEDAFLRPSRLARCTRECVGFERLIHGMACCILPFAAGGGCKGAVTSFSTTMASPGRPTNEVMVRHAALATDIRDAITRADLFSIRKWSRQLAALEQPAGSGTYEIRLRKMQVGAQRLSATDDVVVSAHEFGALVMVCASCHAQLNGPAWADVSGRPPGSPHSRWAMPRHAWAMNQMYIGLLYNSDAPWVAGAELLANRALLAGELSSPSGTPRKVDGLAISLGDIGKRALDTRPYAERARLYGEILASCAGCHERSDGGPLERWHE